MSRDYFASWLTTMMLGLVGVTINPVMATRVMRAANGRSLVNTVHTSAINLGILVGPGPVD